MCSVHPQYVVDENQQRKAVLLSIAEWERIVGELDELDAIRAYDGAKSGPQDSIEFEAAVRELNEGNEA